MSSRRNNGDVKKTASCGDKECLYRHVVPLGTKEWEGEKLVACVGDRKLNGGCGSLIKEKCHDKWHKCGECNKTNSIIQCC